MPLNPELEIKRNHSSFGICMFKNKLKQKKEIFNCVPPEKVETFCAIKSELFYTTPSLNYTLTKLN